MDNKNITDDFLSPYALLVQQVQEGLHGEITNSGSKNSVLAIIAATVIAGNVCILKNVPDISDVRNAFKMVEYIGGKVEKLGPNEYKVDTKNVCITVLSEEISKKFRASYYFWGALISRFHKGKMFIPGGCNFGTRPIDLHIAGIKKLCGKDKCVEIDTDEATCDFDDEITGAYIKLNIASVGATINIMLAATGAPGLTIIENAAKEPHIVDLANFLNKIGAVVQGAGTDTIKIFGTNEFHGCTHEIIPDRIEAATFIAALAAIGGEITIKKTNVADLESVLDVAEKMGVECDSSEGGKTLRLKSDGKPNANYIKTAIHPGFPTDAQPQFSVALSVANGKGYIDEGIWAQRFRYIKELNKFGADVNAENGRIAFFPGNKKLVGTTVEATDLRAGAAMLIAGMKAEGETIITKTEYIERGYENFVEKFNSLGAKITRIKI